MEGFTEEHIRAFYGTLPQEDGPTMERYLCGLHCSKPARGRLGKADGLDLSQFMVNGKMVKECDIKYLEKKLGSISEFGIVHWDEAHQDCHTTKLGGGLGTTTNRQFAYDKNRNYDPDGTFACEY